jgi:hypothetical protein
MTFMNPNHFWRLALGLTLVGAIVGCSSNKNSNPTGPGTGGMGGGREFVSGDIQPGHDYTHVFTTAKVIPYFCRYHGGAGGVGMAGVITVTVGGTPSSHAFSITGNTLPTMTIDVMDTVTWTNNDAMVHTVESDN